MQTYVVDPRLPHHQIAYGDDHLGPGVVVPRAVEDQVEASNGGALQVVATELAPNRVLLPQGPVLVLGYHGQGRWMMTHLEPKKEGENEKGGVWV